ncbi:hypothetical protein EJ997_10430 [Flaviflexus ciconiae]|uniref:Uncharacterized protein n=1 Tax=Flaviflexus ciconiae TaxID=2496867 RepID=A0A3Q9G3N2_9ACTO|nr:hypothetical protein EJ997_10430 [Flaviflexus ciconiae]
MGGLRCLRGKLCLLTSSRSARRAHRRPQHARARPRCRHCSCRRERHCLLLWSDRGLPRPSGRPRPCSRRHRLYVSDRTNCFR